LEGKVAIVTGAGSGGPDAGVGIGQAISTVLAREGASVLLMDRDGSRAQATLDDLADLPGGGAVFVGDVTDAASCAAMVGEAVERFGGLDILVNNAAISVHSPLVETSEELYDRILGINLKGTFLATRAAVPALVRRGGGSIVNIGSTASIRDAGPAHAAYTASKGGQLGMMVDVAGEHGRNNIRVNSVLPGIIASPMQESLGSVSDEIKASLNLLGRMGSVWDIAHAAVWLCSYEASYITGVALPVDGGATIGTPSNAFRARG
jgi:NAD(P)-dependent dehydrogenase (short-subunit alcohol dehydrogenase family)